MTRQNYLKFFAASNAAERWQDEIEDDLRSVGERYMALKNELDQLTGSYVHSGTCFPATVEKIEDHGSTIHISGYWLRRGCSDPESCSLPKELVLASDEDRESYFATLEKRIKVAKSKQAVEAEAEERAELARLQEKYKV